MPNSTSARGRPDRVPVPSPEADELVAAAIGGDADAFAVLFRSTVDVVYQSVVGRCGDHALAEDITSEAYLRGMRSVGRFQGGSRDFQAWMVRIARNTFLDHVKSARVRWEVAADEIPETGSEADPESEALASVEGASIREALERLTEDQQEVLYLRFFQGLPIADVAQALDRNVGAIKALQFRALRSLARVLEAEEAAGKVREEDG